MFTGPWNTPSAPRFGAKLSILTWAVRRRWRVLARHKRSPGQRHAGARPSAATNTQRAARSGCWPAGARRSLCPHDSTAGKSHAICTKRAEDGTKCFIFGYKIICRYKTAFMRSNLICPQELLTIPTIFVKNT